MPCREPVVVLPGLDHAREELFLPGRTSCIPVKRVGGGGWVDLTTAALQTQAKECARITIVSAQQQHILNEAHYGQ